MRILQERSDKRILADRCRSSCLPRPAIKLSPALLDTADLARLQHSFTPLHPGGFSEMHPTGPNNSMPARRKLLGSMVSAAALLGLNAAGAAASPSAGAVTEPPGHEPCGAEDLFA